VASSLFLFFSQNNEYLCTELSIQFKKELVLHYKPEIQMEEVLKMAL